MENSTLDIEFSDLNYTVHVPRHRIKCWERKKIDETTQILQNVSGYFRAGELSAILGPSGAGKTSLLSILAGFRRTGVSGNVLLNGVKRDPTVQDAARRLCCLVPQEFAMLDVLTVSETLHVAVDLKLGRSITRAAKKMKVHDTCALLGLEDCYYTPVSKLSGGEKKRLSCGVELLSNPPLMFFDEPTSGLDACSAYQVLSHLKDLSHRDRRNIVCSIHQPSSRLFQMFDSVLVLARGQRVYHGSREHMVSELSEAEFECPAYYNPADYVLEVATGERGDISTLLSRPIKNISTSYNSSLTAVSIGQGMKEEGVALLVENGRITKKSHDDASIITSACNSWRQFGILLKRAGKCNYRDLYMAKLRFLTNVLVGLILGALYFNIGNDAAKLISNMGCIFFLVMFMFFSNALPAVQTFPAEMAVMLREHLNGWYPLKSYYMARSIADIPLQLLCPSAFLVIAYWMTGQPNDSRTFLQVWVVGLLLTILAQSLGMFIGAATNVKMGIFLVPAISIPMLLFSGYFVRLKDIPYGMQWFSYISVFRFAFEASLIAIYGNGRGILPCSEHYCHIRSPKKFLEELGLEDEDFLSRILGLVAYIIMLRILLYIALRLQVRASK